LRVQIDRVAPGEGDTAMRSFSLIGNPVSLGGRPGILRYRAGIGR